MKSSEILECVKHVLWDGTYPQGSKERFICYAIDRIRNTSGGKLKARIMRDIWPYLTYEMWLKETQGALSSPIDYQKLQYSRLCWIDYLIEEYKSIGD